MHIYIYIYMYIYISYVAHVWARELFQEGTVPYINLHFNQVAAVPLNANDSDCK